MRDVLPIHAFPEPTPSERVLEALGLEPPFSAEVSDLYSRPVADGRTAAEAEPDLAA